MEKIFQYDEVPVLETTSGKLKGYFYDGEYIFKGIPYAQAKRFQMPSEAKWEGVKDAASYGFVCPLMNQETPNGELLVPHRYWPQDEHCQNLNIWTKALDEKAGKPVVVWLHGGGYYAGSAIEHIAYDGFQMCMQGDVVVVSVNHRLNILGYLDLSPFGEKYANSGNAGHADMVAALQWIRKNIALFGGDPDNVTIFGQSGGGMKVADLMQIEEADGLFHKGFIMSGVSSDGLLSSAKGDGREIVGAMLRELNIDESEIEKLETIPYYELAKTYTKVSPAIAAKGGYVGTVPLVNDYYKGYPLGYGLRGCAARIPVLIGTVFGEFSFAPAMFNKLELTEKEMEEIIAGVYGERTKELMQAFAQTYPGKNPADLLSVDRAMRQPSKKLAKLLAESGNDNVYLYDFTLEFPFMHNKIAWHCADIPFFFHNTDKVEICGMPGVSEKLEEQMFGAFMAFARTGDPNCGQLPEWPAVTAVKEPTMIFDRECEVRMNFDDALYELIDSVLPPFNMEEMTKDQDVQH
ncbi:MAG: carboxylesterase family protein [Blautia sp.]|nr:carboxylesterase family protein [Blautia sp.]MCM1202435.1 carboxylesterase family protein [Bacteroides fragilis]